MKGLNIYQFIGMFIFLIILSACGGHHSDSTKMVPSSAGSSVSSSSASSYYTISGDIVGLNIGESVILTNEVDEQLLVSSDGAFRFLRKYEDISHFQITARTSGDSVCVFTQASAGVIFYKDVYLQIICNPPPSEFVYITNKSDNRIFGFSHLSTGEFTSLADSPFESASCLNVDEGSKFAYSLNFNTLTANKINSSSGSIVSEKVSSPFGHKIQCKNDFGHITVDPQGKFAYITEMDLRTVSTYSIDVNAGALIEVPNSQISLRYNSDAKIIFSPSGKYAYLSEVDPVIGVSTLFQLGVDSNSGVLTKQSDISSVSEFNGGASISFDPFEMFLFNTLTPKVTSRGNPNVRVHFMDPSTGLISPTETSTFTFDTYSSGMPIVDPLGKFIFFANNNKIEGFTIDRASGALIATPGSPYDTGQPVGYLTIDHSGKHIYSVGGTPTGQIRTYAIDGNTGRLMEMTDSRIEIGILSAINPLVFNPSGHYAYVLTESGDLTATSPALLVYTVGSTGKLTAIEGSPFKLGFSPENIFVYQKQ